jgi:hypothetical protein
MSEWDSLGLFWTGRDPVHGHDLFKEIQRLQRRHVFHLLKNNNILFNLKNNNKISK